MKDIGHHMKHLQKKVISSSRKNSNENRSIEKLPLENPTKSVLNQSKKELRS